MHRTTISLDDEQRRALKLLAVEQGCSMAEVVRRAVDTYIAAQLSDQASWRERLDEFLTRIRERLPADLPADKIEADITAAREEVRRAERATSRR